jgi:hypothetical protein
MAEDALSPIAQYRAGLEAELALLRQLESLGERQQAAVAERDTDRLRENHDARDRVMGSLVALEHELKPVRQILAQRRTELRDLAEFKEVATLHAQAAEMVSRIIAADHDALSALQDAERTRRAVASTVERGETTLQAYRRVVAPQPPNPALVDRRG